MCSFIIISPLTYENKNKTKENVEMSEIKFGNNEFYIEESGEIIAKIQFIPSGTDVSGRDLIIVNHTVVYPDTMARG